MRVVCAVLALWSVGCKKSPPAAQPAALPSLADPVKQVALRDLREDLATARAAIAAGKNPSYACERLAVAARELASEHDDGITKLLAEAETVYGREGPLAWAESKMKEAETTPEAKPTDCNTVKEMLNRFTTKFQKDGQVLELVKRYKSLCPRTRGGGSSSSSSRGGGGGGGGGGGSSVNLSAQRSECRSRCDSASFDCTSRCQYCGSCVTSMTWDQCNNICNTCKQGCEQNVRFCKAQCGD